VIPSLCNNGKVFRYRGVGEEQPAEIRPSDLGIDQQVRAPQIPGATAAEEAHAGRALDNDGVAKAAAEAGVAALGGQAGPTRDSLVYGAALCLWHLGRHANLRSAADAARAALDSGEALRRLRPHQNG